ncbi:MAG: hypothetical protein A2919_00510 [Candidatus Spechtbacteria bacterium RIFCSPLOWO2_01_FULL_43_12]|uniref:Uncharacterized protein n=1 Tax=Candidatus Spechtbacteria bacterium RIFCSPLOWO2_01_FULL_43_12 TaxID=1802162 RepID=A0A1G2HFF0_9BACT|nr:MAG: hypothetical protein A2919_00510 [Candidatus Spechtbacteria bacterium RIFCSPLOWO2_01_FULL_43_12]
MPKFKAKNIKIRDRRLDRLSAGGFVLIFWALSIDIIAIMLWLFTLLTFGFLAPLQSIPPLLGLVTLGIFQLTYTNRRRPLGQKVKVIVLSALFGWLPFYWTKKAIFNMTK